MGGAASSELVPLRAEGGLCFHPDEWGTPPPAGGERRSKLKGEKERKEGEQWAPSAVPWGWASSVRAWGVWGLFLGRGFSIQALGTQDTLGVESGGTGPRAAVSLPPEVRSRGQQAELVGRAQQDAHFPPWDPQAALLCPRDSRSSWWLLVPGGGVGGGGVLQASAN